MEVDQTAPPGSEVPAPAPPGSEAPAASASASAPAAPAADIPPCPTVYVNNLDEKIKKEELQKALNAVFSQHGRVLDVVALKTLKMRGQAFIVFDNIESATKAVRAMQGFSFYGKPMRVTYAKSKSDATAKLEGTFKGEEKERRALKRKAEQTQLKKASKKQATGKAASKPAAGGPGAAAASGAPAAPNKMLFIENLPPTATELALRALFAQFPHFREVKLVPSKQGLAFAEFENEVAAGVALGALQGYRVDEDRPMAISYARR